LQPLPAEQGHIAAGVQPGQILLGKFRIERVLGMGGMGVVVAATHVTLQERVAIKFLLPQALSNGEAVARFLREARAAVRIKSEHVARVTDVGQLETGAPYMIMEYLDGADLGSIVQRQGALPIEESVEYVLQACEALAEAHALGIVHRDLKPANLFLVRRADGSPSVKVLDFGISKTTGLGSSSDLGMTKTQAVMGSPLYMSPEQMVSARDVDARTDIWALGTILYELLTGKVPFEANTITQLCAMILQQDAPPLRNCRPDAPEALQDIIARSLQKDRNAPRARKRWTRHIPQ
jgi:serine/threonine-protein kinase